MTNTTFPPFTVTPAAIAQIAALGGAIMIDAEDGGCCGSVYAFSVVDDESPEVTGAERYGCPGAWLLVAPRARGVLPGATLDYAARLRPPRFRVLRNPNTPQVCACRRSFGEPWPGPGRPECCSYLPMPWDDDFEPPAAWKRQTGHTEETAVHPS
ncbi:MAG: iron-sulfur cluster assembly accessory protein, partial [Arthrobacter sp.]|nr:iron-sulfur cluster assembly accessory protein [Arthrobacter sp.]